jgi:hypothetical protein
VNNRDRAFRPNRRRSFDDDNYEPPRRNFGFAPASGPSSKHLQVLPSAPSSSGTIPRRGSVLCSWRMAPATPFCM